MTTEYPLDKRIIKYKGVFDYSGIYRVIISWIKKKNFEFHEKKHKEKPYHVGPEIEITWWAARRISGSIQLRIDMFIHLYDAVKTEVIVNGHKKQMINGRIQIDIWGKVIFDYSGQFEDSTFFKQIELFLTSKIMRKEILFKYIDPFDYELYDLEVMIRKFLDMEFYESEYTKRLHDYEYSDMNFR
jgi:hypothetical protein